MLDGLAQSRRTHPKCQHGNAGPGMGLAWPRIGLRCTVCPYLGLLLGAILGAGLLPAAAKAEDLGLQVVPGFRVSLYADQNLANDIFAMTLDSHGRVVVTGPGYIKILHEAKGTRKADKATIFATPAQGGMGICFDGNDLYFCGGGWFSRYRDSQGKAQADGPPEHLLPLVHAEHGGHAMRKGPDGWWYLIGGNDSKITDRLITLPHSPIQHPEAGALLRLTPDGKQCEIIAHGLRNPYDFDFNPAGDLFTYDSDVERDFFLPWYSPTRIYHIAYAGHHGWRLPSYLRSWCRRDFYLDTVDILWPVGRGSPTGVVCYRHDQFPEHYRGGLFALDWTFGKVYFFPLTADGSSYRTQPEVFLEAVGTSGFDPTDIAVAPDGSLFICMGGRGTRGAVYRVEYVGNGSGQTQGPRGGAASGKPPSDLEAVLQAPQPLDAWSRAHWMPLARKLGPMPFERTVSDDTRGAAGRVRAVEVLTEMFQGVQPATAQAGAGASAPLVRARVAWSLGRRPCSGYEQILYRLAGDPDLAVRRWALDALVERSAEIDLRIGNEPLIRALAADLGCADKRVRQSAARLVAHLPTEQLASLQQLPAVLAEPQARLSAALAASWNSPNTSADSVVETALSVLQSTTSSDLRLQAVRLIMLALGDYHLHNPPVEIDTGYSLQNSLAGREELCLRVRRAVRPLFPASDPRLSEEASRLLAMLEDDDLELPARVAGQWTATSSPTADMHYLIVFSRLRGAHDRAWTARVADALLGLHSKLEGREQRVKQTWGDRVSELTTRLVHGDPGLGSALLRHPKFVSAGHVALALSLAGEERRQAARLFMEAVVRDPDFAWSGELIALLEILPPAEVRPLFRAQWPNLALRDSLVLALSREPEAADRDKFLTGLDSSVSTVVSACLTALERLPPDGSARNLVPVLRLLRQLEQEPREARLRGRVLALLVRQTGRQFPVKEQHDQVTALRHCYQPIFDWFAKEHPEFGAALNDTGDEDPAAWARLLGGVDWSKGHAARGEAFFRARSCATCHTGTRALGPDLAGVTTRFSRDDLFTAIIYPSRDVAPAYRTSMIETRKGDLVTGIIAFESADGLIVQTGATTTVRIATPDIVSRLPSNRSLMPNGLLKDAKPAELADLYSYLKTLQPRR
jgi:putative membrane-bound dehydrogenase-like protein